MPSQLERRHARDDIDSSGSLKRKRLQRDGAVRAAEQDICACTEADADIRRNAHIFSGQSAGRYSGCRRENRPAQHAPGAEADTQADRVEGAVVRLRWHLRQRARGLSINALHWLMADDDKSDVRIDSAGQCADLRPGLCGGGHGKHRAQAKRRKQQTNTKHVGRPSLLKVARWFVLNRQLMPLRGSVPEHRRIASRRNLNWSASSVWELERDTRSMHSFAGWARLSNRCCAGRNNDACHEFATRMPPTANDHDRGYSQSNQLSGKPLVAKGSLARQRGGRGLRQYRLPSHRLPFCCLTAVRLYCLAAGSGM